MTAMIETAGVAVDLGGRRVLRDVTLTIEQGDHVAMLGPNGAGKTTLLRTMLGLLRPAEGGVRILGGPVRHAWRHVGYVPQKHAFAWDFPASIEDVVLSGRTRHMGWLRGPQVDDHRAVRRALETTGLADLRHRPVGNLSGGQRQRVLIARALATGPKVLLLDEPFTGVDLPTQDQISELLTDLSAAGTTILVTTHDIAQALTTANRVVMINETVVADFAPSDAVDAEVWMDGFKVGPQSGLLRLVAASCCGEAA